MRRICGIVASSSLRSFSSSLRRGTFRFQVPSVLKQASSFHSSSLLLAPKGKKGGKGNDDEQVVKVNLPDIKKYDASMEDKISKLVDEFSRIRGGRSNPDMFKSLLVDALGSRVPLSEAGQISMPNPSKMVVTTFDPALAAPGKHAYLVCCKLSSKEIVVANSIRTCGMGLSATVEGNTIVVNIPKPSAEVREDLVKVAGKAAEKVSMNYFYSWRMFLIQNL